MATGVCKFCGHSFSSWDINETVCPKCRYEEHWDILCKNDDSEPVSFDNIVTTVPALAVDSTVELPTELTIKAQKIVLENGGVRLVVDNDTINDIDTIEVNGIKFERVKEK